VPPPVPQSRDSFRGGRLEWKLEIPLMMNETGFAVEGLTEALAAEFAPLGIYPKKGKLEWPQKGAKFGICEIPGGPPLITLKVENVRIRASSF
jgi:hypothetical protein